MKNLFEKLGFDQNSIFVGLSQLAKIFFIGVSFILLSRHLGPAQFGDFISISALFYLFSPIVDLGLYHVNVKLYSEDEEIKFLLSGSIFTIAILSIVIAPLAIVIGSLIFPEKLLIIALLALDILLVEKFMQVAHSLMVCKALFRHYAIVETLHGMLRLSAVLLLLYFDGALILWVTLFLFHNLIINLSLLIWAINKFQFQRCSLTHLWNRFLIGKDYLFSTILEISLLEFDRIIVNRVIGSVESGIYGAVMRINNFSMVPINALFITNYSHYFSKGKRRKALGLRHGFRLIKKSLFVSVFIYILVLFFKDSISELLGPEYSGVSEVLAYSALLPIVYSFTQPFLDVLNGTGNQKIRVKILSIVLLINISLLIILLPTYAIFGALISIATSRLLIVPLFFIYKFKNLEAWA